MSTRFGVLISFIALSALLSGAALAYQFSFGALEDDAVYGDRVSFGPGRRFSVSRHVIQVPQAYGRLISITPSGAGTTLWFESPDGRIRNVVLERTTPLVIERKGELY